MLAAEFYDFTLERIAFCRVALLILEDNNGVPVLIYSSVMLLNNNNDNNKLILNSKSQLYSKGPESVQAISGYLQNYFFFFKNNKTT